MDDRAYNKHTQEEYIYVDQGSSRSELEYRWEKYLADHNVSASLKDISELSFTAKSQLTKAKYEELTSDKNSHLIISTNPTNLYKEANGI